MENLCFSQRLKILLPPTDPDCLWLVDGKAFHKPPEFLPGKKPCFRSIPRPLETSDSIQPFLHQDESCFVKVKGFDFTAVPSAEQIDSIGVWIQLIDVADDRHQTIEALSHVGPSGDQENF